MAKSGCGPRVEGVAVVGSRQSLASDKPTQSPTILPTYLPSHLPPHLTNYLNYPLSGASHCFFGPHKTLTPQKVKLNKEPPASQFQVPLFCQHTYLPACLSACPTNFPTYLLTYQPTYLPVCPTIQPPDWTLVWSLAHHKTLPKKHFLSRNILLPYNGQFI